MFIRQTRAANLWAFQEVPDDIIAALKAAGTKVFRRRADVLRFLDRIIADHRRISDEVAWNSCEIINWLIVTRKLRRPRLDQFRLRVA